MAKSPTPNETPKPATTRPTTAPRLTSPAKPTAKPQNVASSVGKTAKVQARGRPTRSANTQPTVKKTKPESAAARTTRPIKTVTATSATRQAVVGGELDRRARKLDLPRRKIPDDVRDALKGQRFNNWGSFRRAVNKVWAKSPSVKGDPFFTKENLTRMAGGLNPKAPVAGHLGKRTSMELDHRIERRDGGKVYETRNLDLRTPLSHSKKLKRHFDIASGFQKPGTKPKVG